MNKHHYMFPLIAAVLVIIAIVWHSLSPDNAIKPQGEPVNPTPAIATATATAGPSEGTPSITATYSPAPDNSPVPSDASSAALRVNVRSRYKVPLAGANVEIHVRLLIPLPVPSSPLAKSTTGEDGQAQLIIPGKGLFILMVSAPGHATHLSHISLETSDKAREITVNLAAAAVLKGSLRTKDNLPVAGVTVGPLINDDTTIREYPVFPFFSRTDESGKFTFDGITPGLYRLQVTVPGYQSAVRDGITIPGNDLDFILEDGGFSASGVTAGARDGTPIPDVGIMLAGEGIFLLHTTGLDGIFRFENLSPGKYYIEPIRNDRRAGQPVNFESNGEQNITDLVVKVNQGLSISGKAIEHLTGEPVAGVTFEVKATGGNVQAVTATDGLYQFDSFVPEGILEMLVSTPEYWIVSGEGSRVRNHPFEEYMPDGDIENVLITLIRQYEVQGKVENADDESIGDYRVKALFQHPDGQSSEPLISKPENNGSFTVRCFGSGKWIAGLFDGRNTLAGETREFTLSPREEPPFITLSPGVPYDVNGRVLDHEGAALPQARVRIKGGMSAQETISDAAGVFFFKSFEKTFKASAESEKYTQAIEEDVSLPLDGELVLKFSMGKILSGIVVERDGNPVPGASITCQWLDLSTLVNRRNTVRADKDGRFRFTDINADFISILTAEAADVSDEKTRAFTRITMTDLPLPNPDLRIVLGSASKIHITILDDQNQNYNGEVTLVIKMWNPESVSYIDRDRVLRKVEEGRCSLDDLEPGNYVINAGNPEGLTGVSDGFECTGDPEGYEVQIRLNRPDEIDGHVYDEASGSPLEDAKIVVFDTRSEPPVAQHAFSTDHDGAFHISGLDDGRFNFSFAKPGYNTVTIPVSLAEGRADVPTPITVNLSRSTGAVHGLVLNSRNEPESGVAVNITGHLGQAALFLEAPRAIETDSDGQFSFESLESGEYTITAEKDHTFIAEEISLTAGETRNLTLNLKRMIKVSGNVEIKDPSVVGQPILMKNMDNDRIYMAPMNTEGHFELFVPPGEYIVNIGEIEVSARVSIADDSEDYFLDLTY